MKNKQISLPIDNINAISDILISDIRYLIEKSRKNVAVTINSALTLLYWKIGSKVNNEILKHNRTEYGKQILATLSQELVLNYGNSFTEKNLRRMLQLAIVFPNEKIVVSLIRQLSWIHFIVLIPLKDDIQRNFIGFTKGSKGS